MSLLLLFRTRKPSTQTFAPAAIDLYFELTSISIASEAINFLPDILNLKLEPTNNSITIGPYNYRPNIIDFLLEPTPLSVSLSAIFFPVLNLVLDPLGPTLEATYEEYIAGLSKLRYDDISLIKKIRTLLVQKQIDHVDVIDGYPENDYLSLPTISVEHDLTYDKPLEITSNKKEFRKFKLDIFARTKGERSDLSSLLDELLGAIVTTDDSRYNEILSISHREINPIMERKFPVHERFYRVDLDGSSSFMSTYWEDDYITQIPRICLELDVEVLESNPATIKMILDKYYEYTGYKLYLNTDNYLYFIVGFGSFDFEHSFNFSSYLGQRVRLGIHFSKRSTRHTISFYIDNQLVSTKNSFIFGYQPISFDDSTLIGEEIDRAFSNPSINFTQMNIYGIRHSNRSSYNFPLVGEKLVAESNDLQLFRINEGLGIVCYQYDDVSNYITINGRITWTLYRTNITGTSFFRRTISELLLRSDD